MHPFKRLLYRFLSTLRPDVRKNYRLVRRLQKAVNPVLPSYRFLDYHVMVNEREIPVRIFDPPAPKGRLILLFFHGGGWVSGDIDTYTGICRHMAAEIGAVVISVDYRLAPEHPFPAGLEDCFAVYRAILEHPYIRPVRQSKIILAGDSAGGNLAIGVSLLAAKNHLKRPFRQILLYPSTAGDHRDLSDFPSLSENASGFGLSSQDVKDYFNLYMGSAAGGKADPLATPLLADRSWLKRQPPTLLLVAELDPLRDEGLAFADRLRQVGVAVEVFCLEEAVHGFLAFSKKHRDVVKCYEIINAFLEEAVADVERKRK